MKVKDLNQLDPAKYVAEEHTAPGYYDRDAAAHDLGGGSNASELAQDVLDLIAANYMADGNHIALSDLKRELAGGIYSSRLGITRTWRIGTHARFTDVLVALGFRVVNVSNHSNRHLATYVTL